MTRCSSTLYTPIIFLAALIFATPSLGASRYQTVDSCAAALEAPITVAANPLPQPLRIRSWNVMKFDLPGSEDELRGHLSKVDLMLLQESVRSLKARAESPTYRYFSPGYKRGEEATGVEIRSRFPADVDCELEFHEPWLGTPKAVSAVRLPFKEAAILLINLHAINFTLTSKDYRAQFNALSTLIRSHSGPVIVAGDFNHWNPWRADALYDWSRKTGLAEIRFTPDWRSRHLGSSVDSLFLRGLKAVAQGAFPTNHSDHHAIAASLALLRTRTPPEQGVDNRARAGLPAPEH